MWLLLLLIPVSLFIIVYMLCCIFYTLSEVFSSPLRAAKVLIVTQMGTMINIADCVASVLETPSKECPDYHPTCSDPAQLGEASCVFVHLPSGQIATHLWRETVQSKLAIQLIMG